MVEKWTPMKAVGKANRALEDLMVPPFTTDLSEQPNPEFSNLFLKYFINMSKFFLSDKSLSIEIW